MRQWRVTPLTSYCCTNKRSCKVSKVIEIMGGVGDLLDIVEFWKRGDEGSNLLPGNGGPVI